MPELDEDIRFIRWMVLGTLLGAFWLLITFFIYSWIFNMELALGYSLLICIGYYIIIIYARKKIHDSRTRNYSSQEKEIIENS